MEQGILLQIEHVVIAAGVFCGAIYSIWRLFDKAMLKMKESFTRDEAQSREKRELVFEARFQALEKRIDSRETHDERLWKAVDEINKKLTELTLQNSRDHSGMSERLSVLEQTGCSPAKGDRS